MRKQIASILLTCLMLLSIAPTTFAANNIPYTGDTETGDTDIEDVGMQDGELTVKSYEQKSIFTGYQETINESYTATVGEVEYEIPASTVIGLPSDNAELC